MGIPTQSVSVTDLAPRRLPPLRSARERDACREGMGAGPPLPGGADVSICVERSSTGCVLRVAGELDGTTCSLLEAMLEHLLNETCGRRIELDLSDVSFADSQGLMPALSSDTLIKTASTAVRHTLQTLAGEKAAAP